MYYNLLADKMVSFNGILNSFVEKALKVLLAIWLSLLVGRLVGSLKAAS